MHGRRPRPDPSDTTPYLFSALLAGVEKIWLEEKKGVETRQRRGGKSWILKRVNPCCLLSFRCGQAVEDAEDLLNVTMIIENKCMMYEAGHKANHAFRLRFFARTCTPGSSKAKKGTTRWELLGSKKQNEVFFVVGGLAGLAGKRVAKELW